MRVPQPWPPRRLITLVTARGDGGGPAPTTAFPSGGAFGRRVYASVLGRTGGVGRLFVPVTAAAASAEAEATDRRGSSSLKAPNRVTHSRGCRTARKPEGAKGFFPEGRVLCGARGPEEGASLAGTVGGRV